MLRLFVAIDLPESVRAALAQAASPLRQHPGARHVRWANLDQAHLTLKFLGDTPESAVPALRSCLTLVAREARPITLALSEIGAFPDGRRPRVIWAGLDAGAEARHLVELHAGLERELTGLGFAADDRAFSPHLTLGRVRQGLPAADVAQVVAMLALPIRVGPASFLVRSVSLISSTLRPAGPIHETRFRVDLPGG